MKNTVYSEYIYDQIQLLAETPVLCLSFLKISTEIFYLTYPW